MLGALPSTLAVSGPEALLIVALAIIVGMVVAFTVDAVRRTAETRAREQTRREVAAYVAEGTVSAADAVKLLGQGSEEAERMIADGVAWGTIKPEKADALIRALRSGEAAKA